MVVRFMLIMIFLMLISAKYFAKAQLEKHLPVDQVVMDLNPLTHPLYTGKNTLISINDPIYGVGILMLKETCLAICAPFFIGRRICD
jgi:hypothetical protein